MKVLIIEDNELAAKIEQLIMKQAAPDAEIYVAPDCATANTLVEKQTYDIILVDFGLPDGHGIELTRTFRHQGITALIAAVSSDLDQATPEERTAAGIDISYRKPFNIDNAKEIMQLYNNKK